MRVLDDEGSGQPLPRVTPAAYPEVLTVTAVSDSDGAPGGAGPSCDGDDIWASYTNYASTPAGAAHTIAAPGSCIVSTRPGGGTTTMSGTSMAAPHVAGLVVLCHDECGWGGADVAPPAVTLLTPLDGARGTDTSPDLSGELGVASGDEPEVAVEVFDGAGAEGAPVRTPTADVAGDRWSASLARPLGDGEYTVRVSQRDASGNVGQATRAFEVDTTGPSTLIDALTVDGLDARVTFSASEAGSSFACALDGGGPASCSSPHELRGLAPGSHVLVVRGTDDLGNVGPIVERSFTVSAPAPAPTRAPAHSSSHPLRFCTPPSSRSRARACCAPIAP